MTAKFMHIAREGMSYLLIGFCMTVAIPTACAEDGTYDATVTTDSGTYTVPVEVEDGEVSLVHWPNGGDMHVYGADISNGEAQGYNSRGDMVQIEVDGHSDDEVNE